MKNTHNMLPELMWQLENVFSCQRSKIQIFWICNKIKKKKAADFFHDKAFIKTAAIDIPADQMIYWAFHLPMLLFSLLVSRFVCKLTDPSVTCCAPLFLFTVTTLPSLSGSDCVCLSGWLLNALHTLGWVFLSHKPNYIYIYIRNMLCNLTYLKQNTVDWIWVLY